MYSYIQNFGQDISDITNIPAVFTDIHEGKAISVFSTNGDCYWVTSCGNITCGIQIHWASKETHHFFRAMLTEIHRIEITPYQAYLKHKGLLKSKLRKMKWNHKRSLNKNHINCSPPGHGVCYAWTKYGAAAAVTYPEIEIEWIAIECSE